MVRWLLCGGHADGEAAGVQGCEGRAKTMTGTVAWALCVGYLAWIFVARVQQLHTAIPADDKDYFRTIRSITEADRSPVARFTPSGDDARVHSLDHRGC